MMLRRATSQTVLRTLPRRLSLSSISERGGVGVSSPGCSPPPVFPSTPYTHSLLSTARGPAAGAESDEDTYWNDLFVERPFMADIKAQDHPKLQSESSKPEVVPALGLVWSKAGFQPSAPPAARDFSTATQSSKEEERRGGAPKQDPGGGKQEHGGAKAGSTRKSKLPIGDERRTGEMHLFSVTEEDLVEDPRRVALKERLAVDRRLLQFYSVLQKREHRLQRRRLSSSVLPPSPPSPSLSAAPPPLLPPPPTPKYEDFLVPSFEGSPYHTLDAYVGGVVDVTPGWPLPSPPPPAPPSRPKSSRASKSSPSPLVIPATREHIPAPTRASRASRAAPLLLPLDACSVLVSSLPAWAAGRSVKRLPSRVTSFDDAERALIKSLSNWVSSRKKWYPLASGYSPSPRRSSPSKRGVVAMGSSPSSLSSSPGPNVGSARGLWTGAPWIVGTWGYDGPYSSILAKGEAPEEAWRSHADKKKSDVVGDSIYSKKTKKQQPADVLVTPPPPPPAPTDFAPPVAPDPSPHVQPCSSLPLPSNSLSRALSRALFASDENFVYGLGVRRPPRALRRLRSWAPAAASPLHPPPKPPLVLLGFGMWLLPSPFVGGGLQRSSSPPSRPLSTGHFSGPGHVDDPMHPSTFALRERAEEERFIRIKEACDLEETRTMTRTAETKVPLPPHHKLHQKGQVCPVTPGSFPDTPRDPKAGPRADGAFDPCRDGMTGIDPLSIPEFEHHERPQGFENKAKGKSFKESMLHGWGWKSGSLLHEFGWQGGWKKPPKSQQDPTVLRREMSTSTASSSSGDKWEDADKWDVDAEYNSWHNNRLRELARRAAASNGSYDPCARVNKDPAIVVEYGARNRGAKNPRATDRNPRAIDLDDVDKVQRQCDEIRATLGVAEYSALSPEVVLDLIKWKGQGHAGHAEADEGKLNTSVVLYSLPFCASL